MQILHVALADRSYPIYIGAQLLTEPELFRRHLLGRQVLIVTNTTVAPLYLAQVQAALGGLNVQTVILPDGEHYKTLDTWATIFDALLQQRFERQCTVLALGGGVVGDITGFAAACYQRGVGFIQVPTTLLAQVDSSVGGKTGVNHPLGKNMVGAFYQPQAVIADTDTLRTLPARELSAGLAEVIKYGAIRDPAFLDWLEVQMPALRALETTPLTEAILRSCRNKAEIVAADEREAGLRALLNFGHTFGHAIETGMGYGTWLHGEAVGTGMVMAAALSVRLGWLEPAAQARLTALIAAAGLPTQAPKLGTTRFLELMAVDKKVQAGQLRLVLLQGLGQAILTRDYSPEALAATLDALAC